jgi:membrane protein
MPPSDKGDLLDPAGRPHLWAVALVAALVVAGFWPRNSPSRVSSRPMKPAGRPASDEGPGPLASRPSEIPARSWKDILLRVYQNVGEHRVFALAAGVTFYSLLAIFPAIAALVAIYGFFSDPATLGDDLRTLSGVLPGGAIDVIHDQLTRVASQRGSTLGLTFIVGLAISLWSANAAIKSMFDTLNIVYSEREKRGFIALNAVSLAFTTAGIALVLIALGAMVVLPSTLKYLGLSEISKLIAQLCRWPVLFVVVSVAIAFIYRFGPSRSKPKWAWITWGSAFAALTWLVASILFSWYAQNFGSYNKTYGSLGAVIGFMTWMWLSTIVILIGAELDAEMEHPTMRAREDPPKPMGAYRATPADTVGLPQDG